MKQTVFAMIAVASLFIGATSCSQQPSAKDQTTVPAEFTISKEKLMDKIKGGWAGQTIGCTYGGPTEFKYSETRSHTDGFQRNNAKCLDEKGISRFVPHSSF